MGFLFSRIFLKSMSKFINDFFFPIIIGILFLISSPTLVDAKLQSVQNERSQNVVRSVESLRDLDFDTWQLVVYPQVSQAHSIVLRVVGYPGTVRINHPTALEVHAGRKDWLLEDITINNSKLVSIGEAIFLNFSLYFFKKLLLGISQGLANHIIFIFLQNLLISSNSFFPNSIFLL